MSKLKFLLSISFVCILLVLCTVASSAESGEGGVAPATIINPAVANAPAIQINEHYVVKMGINAPRYFSFTPTTTGFYTIQSYDSEGDPVLKVYNSDYEQIITGDDYDGTLDFCLTYHFVADATYYFEATSFSGDATYYMYMPLTPIADAVPCESIIMGESKQINYDLSYKPAIYKAEFNKSGDYLFLSSSDNADPTIWIYNVSNFSLVDYCDDYDDEGSLNFRIERYISYYDVYYIVVGNSGTSAEDFDFYTFDTPDFYDTDDNIYVLENAYTFKNINIEGPGTETNIQQASFNYGEHQKWHLQKQTDGYYTIQSQYGNNKYLGVENTVASTNNIKLFTTINGRTKWKIYRNSYGELIFLSALDYYKVLCAPNTSADASLQLSEIGSITTRRDAWIEHEVDSYVLVVKKLL